MCFWFYSKLISPNILTDKFGECIYCDTNASNHKFEEFRKDQSYLKYSTAFENMFAYIANHFCHNKCKASALSRHVIAATEMLQIQQQLQQQNHNVNHDAV